MNIDKLSTVDVLSRIKDGFYFLDCNWNFAYLNNEAERILGRKKEELLGKNVWEEFSDAINLPIHTNYMKAMETQQPVRFQFFYPSMKQWLEVRAYPSSEGLSAYFLDITLDKKKSLTTSQYYESLFTNNPDAVYSFDCKGRFIDANKALEKLTGYSIEELLMSTFHPLIHMEDLEKTIHHFQLATKGLPQNYECRIIQKGGRIIHLKVTNIPITIDQEIVGVYGIAKDITLQKIAEENLENSKKLSLVGQLSASIAHEIRNPLTTLKGFLQLIKTEQYIVPNYLCIMLEEMNRIESITSELLLLAKPQAIHFLEENIQEILQDVVTLLQAQAIMKNIEIIFRYEDVGSIYCVVNQIKQVFINIIKNAIEAMGTGGQVIVQLTNLDIDNIKIDVIDQGCGIPKELAPNIGLPFYSTKEKGTGLGMLTTYKLINDHGGKISFVSEVGVGTTFTIHLPRKTLKIDKSFVQKN